MGGSHSREGLELSDYDTESEEDESGTEEEESPVSTATPSGRSTAGNLKPDTPASVDDLDSKLQSLKLKYCNSPSSSTPTKNPNVKNGVKLYLHIGGSLPSAKWIISEKLVTYSFVRPSSSPYSSAYDEDLDVADAEGKLAGSSSPWFLKIGSKVRVRVGPEMQMKTFPDQKRVDFVADGVWAMKFSTSEAYSVFQNEYQRCVFENVYGFEANEENTVKVFGKDFMAWAKPDSADDSIWEDAVDSLDKPPVHASPLKQNQSLLDEFEEAVDEGGIQSLALGALDNSFLVGDSGIQVVRNFNHGIHGKGVSVRISGHGNNYPAPKRALLMRGESNMLLMNQGNSAKPHAGGVDQLDIETGKIVAEWKFEKDGTDITMRDITNDSKGSQLDPSESTFLGLDDNRLCQWDMRDRRGMVQNIANSMESPVLQWSQGHQFARGTNFQCFATTGDGSIVVGSLDGKIRLYSKSSMRMAKTAFPGLGSPITHVDVTFDGKWVLGTTDTYLILICTIFKDKDGREKTGFSGRMGNRIASPRLLKLTPLDSHLAGKNKFQKGQFSWVTENGKQERHLVATVGKFSVIWNFLQVKKSGHECYRNQEGLKSCYCYRIVPKDESIVDSRFMHEKFAGTDSPDAPLVVATPMKVSSFSISGHR
ncbi:protein CYPRO4-like [Phalaenopsis equestris]|uniref:protein CYPRO4-like n=1 Tax=Phalaenopsis equestris TaxID=78828 RepID=UPI0009E227E0|nr:protein CYPRO4-like [Phalaenopsis equestris]